MTQRSLTVEIERIVPGGLGIGHTDGLTVLAPFTTGGDTVRVSIDRMNGKTVFGSIIELIDAGLDRIEAPCPHYGVCGGCDLQHITYDAQVRAKAGFVQDSFRRIGGISLDEVEIEASPLEWAYRTRAEWLAQYESPVLGYRKRGSREPFDVKTCPILAPHLETARASLHDVVHSGAIMYEGEVQAATGDDQVAVSPRIEPFGFGLLTMTVNGERYGFDPTCFFQANSLLLPAFVEHVISEATAGAEHVDGEAIDLFSGVGLFTIPLARRFDSVTGVESHAKAASYAHENAKVAGLANVTISGLTVEQWLHRRGDQHERVPALVLDPPRAGVEPTVVEGIVKIQPKRIVYVSCDPATLARDVKALTGMGYRLAKLRAYDMFPQTHHVEAVATLDLAPI
ncbi:MAG: class I SAM-dependent RNA methyltransferase [Thermomicrobiales bacterium]|nr:class I SAM-dependent RNA methyltransferase [Thermomicrobiales bacterium]